MVAGDHDGADTGLLGLRDSSGDLGADRVDHAGQAAEHQIVLKGRGAEVRRLLGIGAAGQGQNAQGLVGHSLVGREDLLAAGVGHGDDLAVLVHMGAARQNNVRAALGVLLKGAVGLLDHNGHHLAAGIERSLAHTRVLDVEALHASLGGVVDQSALGRLANGLALLLVPLGIGAQGHAGKELLLGAGELVLDDGHLVLGKGTGLIGADDLGAAKGLDSGHLANDRLALGHLGDAHGQNDGDDGNQALGNSGNGQGHGDHEGVEQHGGVGAKITEVADDVDGEDDHADGENELGKDAGKLVKLHLKRGELLLSLGEGGGDLAHLGLHAGANNNGAAAAVHHGGTHVAHVLAVAQRHVIGIGGKGDLIGVLLYRDGLAGKGGLLDLHGSALENAAVCRHGVARFEQDDITGNQLGAGHVDELAVAHNLGLGGAHLLQGLKGLLGLSLLDHAQNRVQDNDGQNDRSVRPLGLALDEACDHRNGGSNEQHDDHGVCHLLEEALPHGCLLFFVQLVRANARKTRGGLSRGQACLGVRGLCSEHVLGRSQVLLLHKIPPGTFSWDAVRPHPTPTV